MVRKDETCCCYHLYLAHDVVVLLQELTLNHPNIVNPKKNMEMTYKKPLFLSNHK